MWPTSEPQNGSPRLARRDCPHGRNGEARTAGTHALSLRQMTPGLRAWLWFRGAADTARIGGTQPADVGHKRSKLALIIPFVEGCQPLRAHVRDLEHGSGKPSHARRVVQLDAGGGTRTPNLRIMIPAQVGLGIGNTRPVGHAVGHNCVPGSPPFRVSRPWRSCTRPIETGRQWLRVVENGEPQDHNLATDPVRAGARARDQGRAGPESPSRRLRLRSLKRSRTIVAS